MKTAKLAFGFIAIIGFCNPALSAKVDMPIVTPLPAPGGVILPKDVVDYYPKFQEWTQLVSSQPVSPVAANAADVARTFMGADGRMIRAVVQAPVMAAQVKTVTVGDVAEGADARPAFEAALNEVRRTGANRLVIPPKSYTFKTLGSYGSTTGHLIIQNVKDLSIEGKGAYLNFTQNAAGIAIRASERVKISGVTLQYLFRNMSVGTIQNIDGKPTLVVDPKYAISTAHQIRNMNEYDVAKHDWVPGGERRIFGDDNALPTFIGNQKYTSPQFTANLVGKSFILYHYYYGGVAIQIADPARATQDITIDTVRIFASPGMAITAYGIKRGLAVVNSSIQPASNNTNPDAMSAMWDGIHVLGIGGDTILTGNTIRRQGDDGINMQSPVSTVNTIGNGGLAMRMGKYSALYKAGDTLAFFDASNRYVGAAQALSVVDLQNGESNVTLDRAVAGAATGNFVRNVQLANQRWVVSGNTVGDCFCHGTLVQNPNGIIDNNVYNNTQFNAIRLLTNLGIFKEGIGAINVTVSGNNISNTGIDSSIPFAQMPWAAISLYALDSSNSINSVLPANKNVIIANNTVRNAMQSCITAANVMGVAVTGNSCLPNAAPTEANNVALAVPPYNFRNAYMINYNQLSPIGTGGVR